MASHQEQCLSWKTEIRKSHSSSQFLIKAKEVNVQRYLTCEILDAEIARKKISTRTSQTIHLFEFDQTCRASCSQTRSPWNQSKQLCTNCVLSVILTPSVKKTNNKFCLEIEAVFTETIWTTFNKTKMTLTFCKQRYRTGSIMQSWRLIRWLLLKSIRVDS